MLRCHSACHNLPTNQDRMNVPCGLWHYTGFLNKDILQLSVSYLHNSFNYCHVVFSCVQLHQRSAPQRSNYVGVRCLESIAE